MRVALLVVGAGACIAGVIWILQGMDLLGGSFMSGRRFWAKVGAATLAVGVAVLYLGFRMAA